MSGCVGKLRFSRIYNNLLRTLTLIVFGFANINNGLTSYVSKETHNTSSSPIISGSASPISSLSSSSSSLLTTEHMKFLQNQHLTLQQQQQFQLQLKQMQQQQQEQQLQQEQHSIVNQNKLIMSLHSSVLNHTPNRQLTSKDSIDLVNNFNTNTNNNNNNIVSGSGSTIIGTNSRTSDHLINNKNNNNNNNNNNNGISNLLSSDSLISENGNSLLLSGNSDNINLKSSSLLSNSGISSSNNNNNNNNNNNDNVNSNNQIINDNIIDNTDNNNNVNKQQLQQIQQIQTDTSTLDEIYNTPMYFGTENNTVITTQIGATAHMPCTIHHIGDGVVSWIRRKDYHLLTVGLTTYNSDERFSATHLKHSEDWTLQIKFVQLRDAGIYECQVSTHPPTSIFLHLNVVEARAEISGPPIRYLTPGSTLRLQCRVLQNTQPSEFIFWYHDNRMINYDIDRGINVSTEADFQSSELVIQRTRREHSGNFTCLASNAQPASVLVHIFKGDNPAAMYHGHVGSSNKSYQNQFFVNLLLTISIGKSLLYHSSINFFNFV